MGEAVELPCDLSPPRPGETVYLVLWYRSHQGEPLYSYDARDGSAVQWSDAREFGGRAAFQAGGEGARLVVQAVQPGEAGLYRCRVDFRSAPTRNSLVNLTLIGERGSALSLLVTVPLPEPPSSVTIIDFSGEEVETTAGPFQLDTVIRYCRHCVAFCQ